MGEDGLIFFPQQQSNHLSCSAGEVHMSINLAPHSSLPPSLSSTSCHRRRVDLRLASKSIGAAHA